MKNFRVIIPRRNRNHPSSAYNKHLLPFEKRDPPKDQELPSIEIEDPPLPLRQTAKYYPVPNSKQRNALVTPISSAHYTQHRQQDRGRAIALNQEPQSRLISHKGNIWTFGLYTEKYYEPDIYKIHTVTWDGLGTPIAGLSTTSFSQGKTYTRKDGSIGTIVGAPDAITWAVKWLVEGIPENSVWPPIPSKWPTYPWNFIAPWPEYNLIL